MSNSARPKFLNVKVKCKKCGQFDLPTPKSECRVCNPKEFYKIYGGDKEKKEKGSPEKL